MDLCVLVIKLSKQKAGLISEDDVKAILPKEKETECRICGFGMRKLVKAVKGPFGILQIALNIPSKKPVSQNEEAAARTNRLVQLFAESAEKKSKALGVASDAAEKATRFKAALNNLNKRKVEQVDTKNKETIKEFKEKARSESLQAAQMLSSLAKAMRSQHMSIDTVKDVVDTSKPAEKITTTAATAATAATTPVTRRLSKKASVQLEKKKSQRSLLRKKSSYRSGSYKIENINPMNLIKRRMLENRRAISTGKLSITRTFTRSVSQMNYPPKAEVKTIRFRDIIPTIKNERKTSRLRDATKTDSRTKALSTTGKTESKTEPKLEPKATRFLDVTTTAKSEPKHARFQDIVITEKTDPKTSNKTTRFKGIATTATTTTKLKTTPKTARFQDDVTTSKIEPKINRLKNIIAAKKDSGSPRFVDITSKLADEIKTSYTPQLTNVVATTTMRMKAKRKFSVSKNQVNFLKIPKVIDDAVPAYPNQIVTSQELFVFIQFRSILYESIVSCPAHFNLLLSNKTTLHYIAEEIKKVNDITVADVFISPYKHNFRQSLLHHDSTLKECGYRGYCKSHPQKISLFYDFEIIYNITTTTTPATTTNTNNNDGT